jgi:sister-chromatid-cohesion protein PDS5
MGRQVSPRTRLSRLLRRDAVNHTILPTLPTPPSTPQLMPRTRGRANAAQKKVAAESVSEEPIAQQEEQQEEAATPVEEEDENELDNQSIEGEVRPLRFNESLTWRAGKPIVVTELLRRLKTLHAELSQLDQEDAHRDSLVPVAQELAHRNLLEHRDRGVKAWSALCIVEMFKLLAPDAPFKATQLSYIFSFIIEQVLPALANPQDPYNEQHLAIIRSLDEVKSIVLLTDIPNAEALLYKLFTGAFDIFADTSKKDQAEELGKNVEHHVTSLLVTVVDESPSLPNDVVDIILAQFLRLDPSTFPLQLNKPASDSSRPFHLQLPPPAYNMAKNICTLCPDKMSRMVAHYFNSIIADISGEADGPSSRKSTARRRSADDDDEDDDDEDGDALPTGPTAEELKSLEKAHRLLRELWRSAALVIQNIVPQIESELGAENVDVRLLATETVGDLISGIGAAGLSSAVPLDPAAYPSQSIDPPAAYTKAYNFLTTPAAPHAFSSVHASTYQAFLNRRNDKAPQVRSIWVTCAGRILVTSAGGVGLDPHEESVLLRYVSDMLVDTDERVRLSAVQAIACCDFETIVQRIGSSGSVNTPGSVLSNLADRIKDRKHSVRAEAMSLLGRIWGVAAGAITEGNERVRTLLGAIPSRIFDAIYINDREITALVQQVLYDSLLPLNFPPIKDSKSSSNGDSQRVKDSQVPASQVDKGPNHDAIRAERILVLVRDLEQKAKTVFFTFQSRQTKMAQYLEAFLKRCEDYNGGVNTRNGKEGSGSLSKLIEFFAQERPEPLVSNEHLWKFAKKNERRWYHLIRFAISPDSDYTKVFKAIKELKRRVGEHPGHSPILTTILPIVYQASVLVYNKSHVPTIVDISRTESRGLGSPAHEVLKEISTQNPEVFKAHVRSLCATLQEQVPSGDRPTDSGVVETLKACAGFAQRFPAEIPRDRDFLQAMVQFALHGNPPIAAKHAVSVVVAADEKKDMYVKDIVTKCVQGFKYGEDGYLSKLAALSQLMLLSAKDTEDEHDDILEIAIEKVLLQVRTKASEDDVAWQEQPDDECEAKIWALKILANRLRSYAMSVPDSEMEIVVTELALPVFKLLHRIVEKNGELSKSQEVQTPKPHRARLRLNAALLLLKLCSAHKRFDALMEPKNFNRLALIAQDTLVEVRSAFVDAVKKYLGQGRLPHRFYTLVFVYAFEPSAVIKTATSTWLKGRAAAFAKSNETVMEATFARFLSLLAHHPDFSLNAEHMQDFVAYIMFYLKAVATPANINLIYHVAQRMKSIRDGIDGEKSENLYCLSDIAQAVIRRYQELQGWSLSTWTGKLRLPVGLFASLPNHAVAQEISEKQYAPESLMENIEDLVKDSLRTKKRKSENTTNPAKKRARASEGKSSKATSNKKVKSVKTPKKRRASNATAPASEIRRSSRKSGAKSYMEESDDEEEEEEEAGDVDEDDSSEEGSGAEDEEMKDVEERGKAGAESEEEQHESVEPEESSPPPPPPPPAKSRRSARAGTTSKKATKPAATKPAATKPAATKRSARKKKRSSGPASDSELSEAPSDMNEE